MQPSGSASSECPECRGLGWLTTDLAPGQSTTELVRCVCNPVRVDVARLQALSGLAGAELEKRLTVNFPKAMANAARDVYQAVDRDPSSGFIVLIGPNGCGKTFTLQAAVNEAIARNRSAVWQVTERLLDHIRATFDDGGYQETMEALRLADVLCLDEFGAENPTPWADARLRELIDYRYRAFTERMPGGRLTILASNRPLDQWPAYLRARATDLRCSVHELWGAPDMRRSASVKTKTDNLLAPGIVKNKS